MTIHQRIKKKREELGLSQAELGRRVGVTTQAVQQWEDDVKPTAPRRAVRRKVAEALGVPLIWLEYGEETDHLFREQATYEQTHGRPLRASEPGARGDVPIIGFAVANPEEDGYYDDMGYPPGAGEAYVPWPSQDKNAYALRVRGDSMQPRIRPGEIIIVEPNTQPTAGDDVIVKTKSGRKMVKQLLYKRAGEVTLGSINQQHRQLTISLEEIEEIQFVAAIVPRGANVKEGT